jgi:hypothetical protein
MKTLIVKRTTTQYVSRVVGDQILWTHDPALALVMSCAKATALAARLQYSADHAGEQYQPPGEYGVQPVGVQETTP